MIFKPDLAQKVLAGEKTVTRRICSQNPRSPWWRERCALEPGHDYAVQPGRGQAAIGRVRVLAVQRELLSMRSLSLHDALAEGFESVSRFRAAWEQINPKAVEAEVWRIEFDALR
jgi:hypothetical protein